MRLNLLLVAGSLVAVNCGGSAPIDLFADSGPEGGQNEAGPPACPGSQVRCADTCVDLQTDNTHCGACDGACANTSQCVAGKCVSCDQIDADQDGYNACVDCNDHDPNINPGAFDVAGNGVDDNCNGQTDEALLCDTGIAANTKDPIALAHAMEMCDPWLTAATLPTIADDRAHQAAVDWGVFLPQAGANLFALSNGIAADEDDPGYVNPQTGTNFQKANTPYPLTPGTYKCGQAQTTMQDPTMVNDYSELAVTLKVPTNANSFSIDVNYLTTDAPEWLCSQYVDQALVVLDSKSVKGNLLIDTKGYHITADSPYLVLNDATSLKGTGMEVIDAQNQLTGGGTGWMTVTAPVTPGETITLRFIIFDVSDGIFDSELLSDHFRWSTKKVCGPTAVDPQFDGGSPEAGGPDGGC